MTNKTMTTGMTITMMPDNAVYMVDANTANMQGKEADIGSLSVAEAGRRGGLSRAAKHSKEELRVWGRMGWEAMMQKRKQPKQEPGSSSSLKDRQDKR